MKKLFIILAALAAVSFAQVDPEPVATSPADPAPQPVATSPSETTAPVGTVAETAGPEIATSPAEVQVVVNEDGNVPEDVAAEEAAPTCMGGGGIMSFLPMIAIIVIFYFLMIRPQQKQAKQLREMRGAFQVNDRVVTAGGIHGTITNIKTDVVTVRIADSVKIDVDRTSLTLESAPQGESCSTCK